ncbi:MAG: NACHT domain-containing protein [Elainellaceae cyanobacterium]
MPWEAFLRKIADDFELTPAQTDVFLFRFSEENKQRRDSEVRKLLEDLLQLDSEAYKKRKSEIFRKFEWNDRHNPDGCETLKNAGSQKAKRLCDWLELQYSHFVSQQLPNEHQLSDFPWALACQKKLEKQLEDCRLRRNATEHGFEVDVHVGLGLVERKQQQRRNKADRLDLYELTDRHARGKSYNHNQFLNDVIGRSPLGKNKHLAIVGEPGAGKTTLLVAIAQHLSQSEFDAVPIFIALSGVQNRTLKDYILQEWLPEAVRLVNPAIANISELHDSFQQWMYQNPAWFLLDAVDEMGAMSPTQAFSTIQSQLTDWVGQVRVALTCRLNVWDASISNPLVGFDTYKTQEFEPRQVQEFMTRWFEQAEEHQRGERLWQKLQEPQRDRIRELARNPLRLSLLCQIFYTNPEAQLPKTKAGLYQKFVNYFYEWKEELYATTKAQRQELNKALGKLALTALDNQDGLQQFRLPEDSARQIMSDEWFGLAENLGWLNVIDRDSETDEAVYAFFHATFQEYFAASIIENYLYFIDTNRSLGEVNRFRVFETGWKEVLLFWLGRPYNQISNNQKKDLIDELHYFNNQCGNIFFYSRALVLASLGILEFPEYESKSDVIKTLLTLKLGCITKNNERITSEAAHVNEEFENEFEETIEIISSSSCKALLKGHLVNALNQYRHRIPKLSHRNKISKEAKIFFHLKVVLYLARIKDRCNEFFEEYSKLLQALEDVTTDFSISFESNLIEDKNGEKYLAFWGYIFTQLYSALSQINKENHKKTLSQSMRNILSELEARETKLFVEISLSNLRNEEVKLHSMIHSFIEDASLPEYLLFLRVAKLFELKLNSELDPLLKYFKFIEIQNEFFKNQIIISLSDFQENVKIGKIIDDFLNDKSVPLDSTSIEIIHRLSQRKKYLVEEEKIISSLRLVNNSDRRRICEIVGEIRSGSETAIKILDNLLSQTPLFDQISIAFDILTIDPYHKNALDALMNHFKVVFSLSRSAKNDMVFREDSVSIACFLILGRKYLNVLLKLVIIHLFTISTKSTNSSPCSKVSSTKAKSSIDSDSLGIFDIPFDFFLFRFCCSALSQFARDVDYSVFCKVWEEAINEIHASTNIDNIVASDPKKTLKNLKLDSKGFFESLNKLQNESKYIFIIAIQTLENQTENAIAKRLWNRIFPQAFPDEKEIPKIEDIGDLERLLLQLQNQLQVQKLAIVFYDCEPHPNLVSLLNQLTDFLHIGWVTHQPVPFRSFHPEPIGTLQSRVQIWIEQL